MRFTESGSLRAVHFERAVHCSGAARLRAVTPCCDLRSRSGCQSELGGGGGSGARGAGADSDIHLVEEIALEAVANLQHGGGQVCVSTKGKDCGKLKAAVRCMHSVRGRVGLLAEMDGALSAKRSGHEDADQLDQKCRLSVGAPPPRTPPEPRRGGEEGMAAGTTRSHEPDSGWALAYSDLMS